MKKFWTIVGIITVLFIFASCVVEGYAISPLQHNEVINLHNEKSLGYSLQPFNVSSKDGSILVMGYYFGSGKVFVWDGKREYVYKGKLNIPDGAVDAWGTEKGVMFVSGSKIYQLTATGVSVLREFTPSPYMRKKWVYYEDSGVIENLETGKKVHVKLDKSVLWSGIYWNGHFIGKRPSEDMLYATHGVGDIVDDTGKVWFQGDKYPVDVVGVWRGYLVLMVKKSNATMLCFVDKQGKKSCQDIDADKVRVTDDFIVLLEKDVVKVYGDKVVYSIPAEDGEIFVNSKAIFVKDGYYLFGGEGK